MLHPMDRAQLCSGNDLTAEKLPYVIRPQEALNTARRMWANDFERSKLIRFSPTPRHTRHNRRLPFPPSLENSIRTGQLILLRADARMVTAPVVSQQNGELQASALERESLMFRTTIERAMKRSSFSSGRVSTPDTVTDAPMSFADSIAANNKYLLGEDKQTKEKQYCVDLQCVWDNGQSVGETPILLTFDNGEVQRHTLPPNGHLLVTGVSSLFYKAQLKPDEGDPEKSKLRTAIQKILTAIIDEEEAQAALHQSLQDEMGVVDNVVVHTGAVMWGIWNLAKDSVVAVKEWSDIFNPVVAYNHILQAAYAAKQAGPESDWQETFRETYNDLQHREWVEALGFDPSQITITQLAEAYELANFVYEDPPTQKMLAKFGREYIAAQDSVELAESVAPAVIETILGAILTAMTMGAGGTVVAGRVATKAFTELGELLIDLGNVLKKAKLSERIFSKMSNKLEKLEIRRPKAQKVAEPKRVDGNRNDGTMRGESVVPDNQSLVGQLEPGNPRSTSIPRNGDRLVLNQGQLPTCGPNSCAMVLDSSGKTYDLNKLIVDSKVTSQGAYMGDMAKALRNQGLDAARVRNRVSVDELAEATSGGNPAVVATRLDRGGHAVVVDGITTRQGQQFVAIRDPALGRQYFTPLDEFAQRFNGQAILTNPKKP
ncbi:cysteine peptidase family C39 domain-containing protein [Amphritea sp.]|uniref:cysteine peptidase family C39 domain-containing protein n=1 Tax=Amphritea sp. TaxID=1872502 RepID=UPI003D147EDE